MPFPFLDEITAMVKQVMGDRLAPGIDDYLDLYADDGVLELPFQVSGEVKRVEGKAAIADLLRTIEHNSWLRDVTLLDHHQAGAEIDVAEYTARVERPADGTWFDQRYVSVFQARNGRLVLFREYLNPTSPSRAKPA